jgi:MFS family permease
METLTMMMKTPAGSSSLPKPQGRKRWGVLALLCLLALINNIDRLALSIAAPAMQSELGLTATHIGLLGSAFSLFYAFGQLPSGWFVDRFGPRKLLGLSVAVWSGATAAMGFIGSLPGFIVARACLGLAEAPSLPSTNKIVTQWFPKKEHGFANGCWDSALKAGPAFFTVLLVWIVAEFGWREMFILAGIAGVVVAAIFMLFYRDLDSSPNVSAEELSYIRQDGGAEVDDGPRVAWASLFRKRSMWGMMAGFFCNMWAYQIFLVFIPLFIINQFGVKFASLGLIASVPWVGAIIGDLASGLISGKLSERAGWTTMKAKKVTIIASMLLQALVLALIPFNGLFGEGAGLAIAVTLMAFALGFNGAVVAHAWSLPCEFTTPSTVASVGSIQNFGGFIGATLSPLVAGLIIDATHSFNLVFFISAGVAVLSALFYHFGVRQPIVASPPAAAGAPATHLNGAMV